MRKLVIAAFALGFATVALAREPAPAQQMTAEQIVDRNVAARGGLEAWRKIETMVWVGHIESSHAPVPGVLFTMQQKRPNKSRFETNALGEKTVRAFDGTRGWKLKPNRQGGPDLKPFSPQEVTFAFRSQAVDGPLIDYQAKRNQVALEGIDQIEGRQAFRLKVDLASGETDHVWVDAATFLEVRYDRPSYGSAGTPTTVSVFYRDYKTVEGLQIPSVIETAPIPGAHPDRMVIERMLLNTSMDDRTFAPPGARERRGGMTMRNESRPPGGSAPIKPAGTPAASSPDPAAAPASRTASGPN